VYHQLIIDSTLHDCGDCIRTQEYNYTRGIIAFNEIYNCTRGIENMDFYTFVFYNYIHDCTGAGMWDDKGGFMLNIGNVFDTCNIGIHLSNGRDHQVIIDNLYWNMTNSGFYGQDSTAANCINVNNISSGNGAYGFQSDSMTFDGCYDAYLATYDNDSGAYSNMSCDHGCQTTDPGYTDPSNGDFSMDNSGSLVADGLHQTTPDGNTISYQELGPIQAEWTEEVNYYFWWLAR